MSVSSKIVCQKCNKAMEEENFYTYKDGTKTEFCKKCLTMHIDNFNPETFLWLLEKMDVPYVPEEWNVLRDRAYARQGPMGMNGMSVFGKYLSKMKLKQWKQYSWADTEKLRLESQEKEAMNREIQEQKEKEAKEKYEKGEITEAEYRTITSSITQHANENILPFTKPSPIMGGAPLGAPIQNPQAQIGNPFDNANFIQEEELDLGANLTQEDKIAMAMKWGRMYKPSEWVELESKYNEMMNSFDIQDSDTIGTLILICKTYLKMNQALDQGDLDGYQKLSRVYDSLRKSAKFTAAQNKEKKENCADAVGVLVEMCEREGGFIPRFVTDIPQDKVDATIRDTQQYLSSLVKGDLGFGHQIEEAIKKLEIQRQMAEEQDEPLKDSDYMDYYNEVEAEKEEDNKNTKGESE